MSGIHQAFKLALRNLQRNRRRSITTLLAMVVGVCAILLFGGFSRDITLGMQTDIVQHSGHLQIQRHGYFLYGTGNSAAYGIPDYQRVIDTLRADPTLAPMVRVLTPTLNLGGVAGNFNAGVSRTVLVNGSIAADQTRMLNWNEYGFPQEARASALEGTPDNAAVTGVGLARVLQLCAPLKIKNCPQADAIADHPPIDDGVADGANAVPGAAPAQAPADVLALAADEAPASPAAGSVAHIDVLAASARGAPNVANFEVVQAQMQGVKEFDDIYLTVHLAAAQRLVYGREAPRVTAIEVQLHQTGQLPQARARIEQLLAQKFAGQSLEVLDFSVLDSSYNQINDMFGVIFGFVFVLISAIVLFVVSNTMSTVIVERTVEIGTLRAMGTRRSGIEALFVCEGLLLGFTGAALGVVVALGLAFAINHCGLTWVAPARVDEIPLTVRVWGAWPEIALTFMSLGLVASLSAWWPARQAARLSIVDALRHV